MDAGGNWRGYSCNTASETLEWIDAIVQFLKSYRFFLDAHVVNFFKDRLWEEVDDEWMDCLRREPMKSLLQIPSGVIQDHWPASLKQYVHTLASLSFSRDQVDLEEVFHGLRIESLNDFIAQGMNKKKKHEIEALAAVISSISKQVGAKAVVDVGSGQGYLAQVLSFEHDLSVVAIDASSHHGSVTASRAQRILKYYAARKRKLGLANKHFNPPRTVTCQVLSTTTLKDLLNSSMLNDGLDKPIILRENTGVGSLQEFASPGRTLGKPLLVLAGLHACGDLSVNMLRTFVECDQVKAVVSIGCCYNLLSEEDPKDVDKQCGFPVSTGAKAICSKLGKNARDLACQSADRWRVLDDSVGLHNFELHAFRAAFQMVLLRYYPEIIQRMPAIGRQGKALRRHHQQSMLHSCGSVGNADHPLTTKTSKLSESVDRYSTFVDFCKSGLAKLNLHDSHIEYSSVWKEAEEHFELVGPYWTLRAALGPVLETLLLLDRLLFLQEQENPIAHANLVPLFDPALSPRNVALIAKKF